MKFSRKISNSIKFRTRYFLFSKLNLPSTSISSYWLEHNLYFIDKILRSRHGVSLSVGIKPIDDNIRLDDDKFGIVYHGKIIDADFLIESLTRMRLSCPKSVIVLSTYSIDLTEVLRHFCLNRNIVIVEVDDPGQLPAPHAANLARAAISAHSGLVRAKELGADWALKIRVDQDLSKKSGLRFVKSLLEARILPGISMDRVIGSSYNTYKDLPLFLSDMLHFGSIEVLLNYWTPFHINEINKLTEEIFHSADDELLSFKFVPEVWLAARYMQMQGVSVNDCRGSNDLFWNNYAGVVDSVILGQNWAKTFDLFDSNYASIKWFEESFNANFLELRFSDWVVKVIESAYDNNSQNLQEN